VKVAITGHTSGLGAELWKRFEPIADTMLGFSRSNGYDISVRDNVKSIIEQTKEYDVFINNAYWGFAQVDLLNAVYKSWLGRKGTYVINISSNTSYHQKTRHHPYAIHKIALDEQIRQIQALKEWPTLMNFRPGAFESKMANMIDGVLRPKQKWQMETSTAADFIMYAFNNRHKFIIRDVMYEPL
jgi:short-subunit dehydrogenase